jgi:hypothetical protein
VAAPAEAPKQEAGADRAAEAGGPGGEPAPARGDSSKAVPAGPHSSASASANAPSADKDEPEKGSKCTFQERDPAQRPKHYVAANRDSNIIFYQRPGGPLWSDADPDRALAELRRGDVIVAARAGKKDLWIRPTADLATLEAGKYRLGCD